MKRELKHAVGIDFGVEKPQAITIVFGPVLEIAPCFIKTRGRGVVYRKDLSFVELNPRILNPDRLMASQRMLVEED